MPSSASIVVQPWELAVLSLRTSGEDVDAAALVSVLRAFAQVVVDDQTSLAVTVRGEDSDCLVVPWARADALRNASSAKVEGDERWSAMEVSMASVGGVTDSLTSSGVATVVAAPTGADVSFVLVRTSDVDRCLATLQSAGYDSTVLGEDGKPKNGRKDHASEPAASEARDGSSRSRSKRKGKDKDKEKDKGKRKAERSESRGKKKRKDKKSRSPKRKEKRSRSRSQSKKKGGKEKEKDRDRDRKRSSPVPSSRKRAGGFDSKAALPQSVAPTLAGARQLAMQQQTGQSVPSLSDIMAAPGGALGIPNQGMPTAPNPEVEAFLALNPVSVTEGQRLRMLPLQLQRAVIERGTLMGAREPSAVLNSRIREAMGGTGAGLMPAQLPGMPAMGGHVGVEALIARYGLDAQCGQILRNLPAHVQAMAAELPVHEARNPSAFVMAQLQSQRFRQAQSMPPPLTAAYGMF